MGLGRAPAVWAAALGGVAFAALFDLLSVKQDQEQQEEGSHEGEDKPQPAQDPAPQPAAPAYRPGTPVLYAASTPRVTVPLARPTTPRSTTTTRSPWSSVAGLFARKPKRPAGRESVTRQASGD